MTRRSTVHAAPPTWTRRALLTALVLGPGACRSREPDADASASPAELGSPLQVTTWRDVNPTARGGTAVVLLHGWGAAGDDLVSLARRLNRPDTRFFVPAGPLARGAHGRAWWQLDPASLPPVAISDDVPPSYRPQLGLLEARQAVQRLLREIRQRHAPERLFLAGFSQGAMLSLDVALAADPPVDGVAALSGMLLPESLPLLEAPKASSTRVFLSHGRQDRVLPFAGAERARRLLSQRGFRVTWTSFDGGHQIPPEVVTALAQFIDHDG